MFDTFKEQFINLIGVKNDSFYSSDFACLDSNNNLNIRGE